MNSIASVKQAQEIIDQFELWWERYDTERKHWPMKCKSFEDSVKLYNLAYEFLEA